MEQTTVTKVPVSESGKTQEQLEKDIENRVRENLKAEYDRKALELSDKFSKAEETIQALQDKVNITEAEKEQLRLAEAERGRAERDLQVVETHPDYIGMRTKIAKDTERMKNEAIYEAKFDISLDLAHDLVDDTAKTEKIESKKLQDEINQILNPTGREGGGRWISELPLQRARLALQERSRIKDLDRRESELKAERAKLTGFQEDGTKLPRDESIQALRGSNKIEDQIALAKKLGI